MSAHERVDAPAPDPEPAPAPEPKPKKKARRRWKRWLIDIALVIGVLTVVNAWQRRNLTEADGEPAPEISMLSLDGQAVTLSSFRGKRVLLHFWATWCPVCRTEHGALNAVFDGLDDDAVLVSVVPRDEGLETVRAHLAEHEVRYPVYFVGPEAAKAYGVTAFPTNFFIDAEGRLVGRDVGMTTRWGMRARLGCAR